MFFLLTAAKTSLIQKLAVILAFRRPWSTHFS